MNAFTILAIAVIGIGATVYLVKEPIKHRITSIPDTPLQEYTERLNKAKIACNRAGGVLIVDDRGQMGCALLKSRWISG